MFARPRRTASELHARRSIESSIGSGVPPDAVAFAARWWQLETWLRELLYLELRAKHGTAWEKVVEGRNQKRADLDADNKYMPSPDAEHLLAYTDTGSLLKLIATPETWELVEPSLLPRVRWDGLVDALRDLRNRNAHVRRPHADDLARLEQALRDLEPGARRALLAFNQQRRWWKAEGDPLAVAWLERGHDDAKRLINHARRQYGTDFTLSSSARPWVVADQLGPISGRPGYFWHAEWTLHDGRFLSPRDFWHCYQLDRDNTRDLIVHVVQHYDGHVSVSFAAIDEPGAVADAIGACFDAVITASHRHVSDRRRAAWAGESRGLDPRVHVDSALAMMTEDAPFTVFAVGGT